MNLFSAFSGLLGGTESTNAPDSTAQPEMSEIRPLNTPPVSRNSNSASNVTPYTPHHEPPARDEEDTDASHEAADSHPGTGRLAHDERNGPRRPFSPLYYETDLSPLESLRDRSTTRLANSTYPSRLRFRVIQTNSLQAAAQLPLTPESTPSISRSISSNAPQFNASRSVRVLSPVRSLFEDFDGGAAAPDVVPSRYRDSLRPPVVFDDQHVAEAALLPVSQNPSASYRAQEQILGSSASQRNADRDVPRSIVSRAITSSVQRNTSSSSEPRPGYSINGLKLLEDRCQAVTKKGTQCKSGRARNSTGICGKHPNYVVSGSLFCSLF